jgi:uncharacterized protein YsxB (DUF464 family)
MIKVRISYRNNNIETIVIEGHASYDEAGKDIVCASVSSIVATTINAMIRLDNDSIDYQDKEGYVKIIIKKHDHSLDILVDNMLDLLKELENDYNKYIKINEEVHPC